MNNGTTFLDPLCTSIDTLEQNWDVIIRRADKGGSLVIQNKDDYIAEARRLLGDTNTYIKREMILLWNIWKN